MSEEGDGLDGEEELTPPDRRMRAGPSNKPTQKEREEEERRSRNSRLESANRPQKQTDCKRKGRTRSNTCTVQRLVHTLQDWQRAHPSPRHQQKSEDQSRRPTIVMDYYFIKMKLVVNTQTMSEECQMICIRVKEDRHKNIMSRVALKKGSGRTVDN